MNCVTTNQRPEKSVGTLAKGFTLVELLVAILILLVGLLGLAQLQITAMRANSHSQNIMVEQYVGQMVYEHIRALPASSPVFSTPQTGVSAEVIGLGLGNVTVDNRNYDVTVDIIPNYMGVSNLCQIEIYVNSTNFLMNVFGNYKRGIHITCNKVYN